METAGNTVCEKDPGASEIPDMSGVLERIEQLLKGGLPVDSQVPAVGLYILWHQFLRPEHHRAGAEQVIATHGGELSGPSMPAFVVRAMNGHDIEWSDDEVTSLIDGRRTLLNRKPDQALPVRFDAALLLVGAQRLWPSERTHAQALIAEAVELLPGDQRMWDFEVETAGAETMPIVELHEFVTETGSWAAARVSSAGTDEEPVNRVGDESVTGDVGELAETGEPDAKPGCTVVDCVIGF